MERLSVVSPLGVEAVQRIGAAPRLGSLDGKTIGEFWNGVFKGDVTFPVIRRLLAEKYPAVKIIPFDEFPLAGGSDHPAHQREYAQALAAAAKRKGCDAVISGNGA